MIDLLANWQITHSQTALPQFVTPGSDCRSSIRVVSTAFCTDFLSPTAEYKHEPSAFIFEPRLSLWPNACKTNTCLLFFLFPQTSAL